MQIEETELPGVLILTPARHGDARGFFSESWNRRTLEQAGMHLPTFVQDNHPLSAKAGTLRGLLYQAPPHEQGKLVRCGRGALYDVAVDGRRGSATYGQWIGAELSFENGRPALGAARVPARLRYARGRHRGCLNAQAFTTRPPTGRCAGTASASTGAWPILSDKDKDKDKDKAAVPFADWQSPFEV